MKFSTPKSIVWVKVNGDITEGTLTSNLAFVPKDFHPTVGASKIRGYKRLFCTSRGYWISLYTKNILAI